MNKQVKNRSIKLNTNNFFLLRKNLINSILLIGFLSFGFVIPISKVNTIYNPPMVTLSIYNSSDTLQHVKQSHFQTVRKCSLPFKNFRAENLRAGSLIINPCDPVASGNTDTDNDGIADVCDLDDDNDGILDLDEGCNDFIVSFPNADKGYLFQDNPTKIYTVDIQTGASTLLTTLTDLYNAVAINEEDGLIWAVNQGTGKLETLNPNTFTVVTIFPGNYSSTIAAAYDALRKRYVCRNPSGFSVVDADPGSPSYGTVLSSFNSSIGLNDFAYNSDDGFIYGVLNGTLYRIDIFSQTVTARGTVSGLPAAGGYGAAYSTFDGRMFFGRNGTGDIYVIDLANGLSASLFSNGPSSFNNDGAKVLGVDLDGNPLCLDTDNDGIPNSLDTDSDNDGCPDALEGGGFFTHVNIDNNGRLISSIDANGVPLVATSNGQTIGSSLDPTINNCCDVSISNDPDNDSDGISDVCDLDDDNDGILDLDEGCNDFITTFPNAEKGYLFQDNPTKVYTVNIQTGASALVATLSDLYNAVTINEEDGLFWAVNQGNGKLETLNPNTFAVVNTFTGNYLSTIAAAYDPIRKRYVSRNPSGFNVIDADPNSPSYGNLLSSFTNSIGINDFTFNSDDGFMYGVLSGILYQIDIDNQVVTASGTVNGLPTAGGYGAAYSTFDGRMFFGRNGTGDIYVIDLSIGLSATLFSTGPSSSNNDGAKVLGVDLDGSPLCLDSDNDGIPNSFDTDSDNDGCPDALEGGGTFTYLNIDSDDRLISSIDPNGIPIIATPNGQSVGTSIDLMVSACCSTIVSGEPDNDGDGIIDECDNDDDNDGILDANENACGTLDAVDPMTVSAGGPFSSSNLTTVNGQNFTWNTLNVSPSGDRHYLNSNGSIRYAPSGNTPSSTGKNFNVEVLFPTPTKTFQIKAFDFDGVSAESIENFSVQPTQLSSNAQNISGKVTSTSNNQDIDLIWNLATPINSITFTVKRPSTNLGISFLVGFPFCDTDSDGIIDALDTDSDGDGCPDVVESGGIDANNDGILDGTGIDGNGQVTGGTGGYNGATGNEIMAHRLNIVTSPSNLTRNNGQPASFTINAQSDQATLYTSGTPIYGTPGNANDSIRYQWYNGTPGFGGTLITNGGVFSGATTNTLTISDVTGYNGTQICAVVTHYNNSCLEEVRCAILSVTTNEICNDGMDNDGDGLIDCADPDCSPIIINVMPTPLSCPLGSTNGQISILAIGPEALSYSITNEPNYQTNSTFTNLGQGLYTIRVRSTTGCIATYSTNIIQFDTPSCPEICNDGIDNDGDGLIDCDDPDCGNLSTANQIIDNE